MGSSTDALRFRSSGAEGAASATSAVVVVVVVAKEAEEATFRVSTDVIRFDFTTLVAKGFETRLNIFWFVKVLS